MNVFARAADLIETKGWTQGTSARTATGDPCSPDDPKATCFCASGALAAVGAWGADMARLRAHLNIYSLSIWNDRPDRTAAEVIAALRACA